MYKFGLTRQLEHTSQLAEAVAEAEGRPELDLALWRGVLEENNGRSLWATVFFTWAVTVGGRLATPLLICSRHLAAARSVGLKRPARNLDEDPPAPLLPCVQVM